MKVKRVKVEELLKMFPDTIDAINKANDIMERYKVPSKREVNLILNTADTFPLYYDHLERVKRRGKVQIPNYLLRFFTDGDIARAGDMADFLMAQATKFIDLWEVSQRSVEMLKIKWKKRIKSEQAGELTRIIEKVNSEKGKPNHPKTKKKGGKKQESDKGSARKPKQNGGDKDFDFMEDAEPARRQDMSGFTGNKGSSNGQNKIEEARFVTPKSSGNYTMWDFGKSSPLEEIRIKNSHIRNFYRGIDAEDIKIWLKESKKAKKSREGVLVGYLMLNEDMKKKFGLNTFKVPIYVNWRQLVYGCIFVGAKRRGKTVLLTSMLAQLNWPQKLYTKSSFPKNLIVFDPKPDFNPAFVPYRQTLVPATQELKRNIQPNELLYAPLGRWRPSGKTRGGRASYRPMPSATMWKRVLPLMLKIEAGHSDRIYVDRFKTFLESVSSSLSITELLEQWSKSSYHAQMKTSSKESIDSALQSLLSKTYLFAKEDYSKPPAQRSLVNYTPKELCHTMHQMGHRFAMTTVIRMADPRRGAMTMSARLPRDAIGLFSTAIIGEVIDYVMAGKITPPIIVVEEAQQALNEGAPVSLLCKDLIRTHGNLGIPLFFVLQQISASHFKIDKDLLGSIPAKIFFTIDLNDERNIQDKFGYQSHITDAMKRLPPGTFYLDVAEMPRIPIVCGDLSWVTEIYFGGTNI